jgi:hypothetical protein
VVAVLAGVFALAEVAPLVGRPAAAATLSSPDESPGARAARTAAMPASNVAPSMIRTACVPGSFLPTNLRIVFTIG